MAVRGHLWAEFGAYCGLCENYVPIDPDVTGDTVTQFVQRLRSALQVSDVSISGARGENAAHFVCRDCISGVR